MSRPRAAMSVAIKIDFGEDLKRSRDWRRCFWINWEWSDRAGSRRLVKRGMIRRTASIEFTKTKVRPGYLRRK